MLAAVKIGGLYPINDPQEFRRKDYGNMKNHELVSVIDSFHVSSDGDVARISHSMIECVSLGSIVKYYNGDMRDAAAQLGDAPGNEDPGEYSNDYIPVDKSTCVLEGRYLQYNAEVTIMLITEKKTCDYDSRDDKLYFLM